MGRILFSTIFILDFSVFGVIKYTGNLIKRKRHTLCPGPPGPWRVNLITVQLLRVYSRKRAQVCFLCAKSKK